MLLAFGGGRGMPHRHPTPPEGLLTNDGGVALGVGVLLERGHLPGAVDLEHELLAHDGVLGGAYRALPHGRGAVVQLLVFEGLVQCARRVTANRTAVGDEPFDEGGAIDRNPQVMTSVESLEPICPSLRQVAVVTALV